MVRIMCAVPGAGKSTFIKRHKKEKDFIICPDEIRKELTGNISDQSKNKEVWELAYSRLKEAFTECDEYTDVWFDATNCKISSINKILDVIKEVCENTDKFADIQFEVMEDSYDPELCKKRIHEDIANDVDRSDVPDEVVDRMFSTFKDIDFEAFKNELLEKEEWIANCNVKERHSVDFINDYDTPFMKMIKQEVADRLLNWKNNRCYPCDLGFQLSETENANGSWYCSRYEAREDIKKYLEEYEAYCGWFKANFGEPEYFEGDSDDYNHDIECVHCRMMINAIESCFDVAYINANNKGLFEEDFWNEKIEITQDFIDAILSGLKEIDSVEDIW